MFIPTIATDIKLSRSSINRITKKYGYYPYKMSMVQHLRVTDGQRHLNL